MGDDLESKKSGKEMVNSAFDSRIPRDLLQRFGNLKQSRLRQEGNDVNENENENDESDDLELNLGLSLGGRFGVNKTSNSLIRSSSIAGTIPLVRDEIEVVTPPAMTVPPYASLVRTSSLPVETEEEWRKRKEIQSFRRMAAKRRRSEKQRAGKGGASGEIEVNSKGKGEREQYIADMTKVGSSATPQFGVPSWAAAAKQAILGVGIEALIGRGKINSDFGDGGSGSIMKEASGLELEKKPIEGSTCGDMSRASAPSVPDQNSQTTVDSARTQGANTASKPSGAEMDDPSKNSDAAASRRKSELNSLEDMPSVFTKGDGPNGRRIEGILYKYGKGEDVRIMCVCHGTFHSPAGFVKHAGGTDINHPLKHIVVNPNSSFS